MARRRRLERLVVVGQLVERLVVVGQLVERLVVVGQLVERLVVVGQLVERLVVVGELVEQRGLGMSTRGPRNSAERSGRLPAPLAALAAAAPVAAFAALLAGAAVAVQLALVPASAAASDVPVPPWLLVIAFAAAEVFVVHFYFARDTQSFSLSELPLVLGLFFVAPHVLIATRLLGSALALVVHRRQRGLKLVLNVANWWLATALTIVTFRVVLDGASITSSRAQLATLAAVAVGEVVTAIAIGVSMLLRERRWRLQLRQIAGVNLVGSLATASLGLLTATVVATDRESAWLLVVVAAVLFLAYRAYAALQQRHESVERLYDFTQLIGNAVHAEAVALALLPKVRELLRADIAEITFFAEGGTPGRAITLRGATDAAVCEPDDADPFGVVAWARGPLLVPKTARDATLRTPLAARGFKDAVIVPLRGDEAVVGTMLVADRLGEVSTFDADDLKLLETLANHASVSLENGRLVDRLRLEAAAKEQQAAHDALTGLPNRLLFARRVTQALTDRAGRVVAVLLLDLDRFKEVNDTLGHQTGDLLLQEIGARLRSVLRSGDTIARLGGDEYAVLLPALPDVGQAELVAQKIRAALEQPFSVKDLSLVVAGSIGIAAAPQHGDDATMLLQRADVAMYAAKSRHSGVEIYSAARDSYSPRRLAFVAELRAAIDEGDLDVHFQPKVDLRTGDAPAVEALVRWHHPEHGFIPPDEFIPVAEQTGLIRDVTRYVLRRALTECRSLHESGFPISVAVNLSARSLLDPTLVDDVIRLLADTGVAAQHLTLELTESSIMVDPTAAKDVLTRLSDAGVRLSVDDFGTGYSSLSYLTRLPVDEIKVDRSFVMQMGTHENAVIVRSTIDLGRNLGLSVVAEGVEDVGSLETLAALGCDFAQGYHMSRPLASRQLFEWLLAWRASGWRPAGGAVATAPRPASSA